MEAPVNHKIIGLKTILLAEDDPEDVELMLAALELGAFWSGVNEPPPYEGEEEEEDLLQRRAVSSPGKREVHDEIPAPHPALGG